MKVTLTNNKTLLLDSTPINSGGEGGIYAVNTKGYEGMVAKIYTDKKKAVSMAKKIRFMIEHSPLDNIPGILRKSIVWPVDMLFNKGEFVGFLMPKINDTIQLTHFTLPNSPLLDSANTIWNKFSSKSVNSFIPRLKIAYNLCQTIEILHKSNNYVLVDLKPDNILVSNTGRVFIIDLDSIQITHKNQLLFPAQVFTEDYAPPEFHNGKKNPGKDIISKSWDYFSLSVILYQIFLGIHPFMASHKTLTDLPEFIKRGLFPNGKKQTELFVIPKPHENFKYLPAVIKKLFIKSLDGASYNERARPDCQNWYVSLLDVIQPGRNVKQSKKTNNVVSEIFAKTGNGFVAWLTNVTNYLKKLMVPWREKLATFSYDFFISQDEQQHQPVNKSIKVPKAAKTVKSQSIHRLFRDYRLSKYNSKIKNYNSNITAYRKSTINNRMYCFNIPRF